ncbi:MAG: hypothetical protein WAL71_04445 [Terriglobales bacterium]
MKPLNARTYGKCIILTIASTMFFLAAGTAAAQSLGGNNNYLLSNSCNNIQGLTVSLHVTKDMVADVTPGSGGVGTPNGGFAMQLNANPPAGEPVFWMQYGIIIENNQALGFIQYWNGTGVNNHNQPTIVDLPSNTIAAGSVLTIQLANDSNGNITATTFSVTDKDGNVSTLDMPMPTYPNTNTPVLSPIQTFQLDVVGPINWERSTFSSGDGYLTYQVSNGKLGTETAACPSGNGTGETSNTFYGTLSPGSGSPITQPFTTPKYGRATTAFSAHHVEGPISSNPRTCLSENNGAVVNNCTYPVSLEFDLPIDTKGTKSVLVQDYWSGTNQEDTFSCQTYAYTGTQGSSTGGTAISFNAPLQIYDTVVDVAAAGDSIQLICWSVPPGGGVANLNWTP